MADASFKRDQVGPGLLLGVVGPSGAGKDTLIASARHSFRHRSDVVFPRRVITRTADSTEDSDYLSADEFAARQDAGDFALSWTAHGLCYGLPNSTDEALRAGHTVVVNLSRSTVPQVRARYENALILLVNASPAIRASRIAARGRESEDDILARLSRSVSDFGTADADLVIDNSGELSEATRRFAHVVLQTLCHRHGDAIDA